jgi:hypothetical protein
LDFARAQEQMRYAYFGGAPGMLVSAAVWTASAVVAGGGAFTHAVWTLFIGGMAIHPLGLALAKLLGRPGAAKGNPLDRLAFESTIAMLAALPMAWTISLAREAWFFPAMLLVIGGRYVIFASVFGLRVYWACGGLLLAAASMAVGMRLAAPFAAAAGAAIEAAFALVLFTRMRAQAAPAAQASPA